MMITATTPLLPVLQAGLPLRPSDAAAADLPEYEPISADLNLIDSPDLDLLDDELLLSSDDLGDDGLDERLDQVLTLSAYAHTHRQLQQLRHHALAAETAESETHLTDALTLVADAAPTDLKIGCAA
ncbi:hypothetical protein C8D87_1219 [Lentzea atacamensis]|uniref:Secreted protein n=1 Tax=Lentzea atacamensis TaxID=531938 RepID=A0ABX9DUD4_9PSEU|nr:hypothetical protein [Lentzea atacamensis]RAS57826.1 hypothetical protein C8D87_1219 [Lentzea atacamensis]